MVAKSHLKRVFTWGNGEKGQLGHGDYFNKERPVLLNLDIDSKVLQVSGGHSSTLLLFSNHKLFWFGTTSTISKVNRPLEVELDKKVVILQFRVLLYGIKTNTLLFEYHQAGVER